MNATNFRFATKADRSPSEVEAEQALRELRRCLSETQAFATEARGELVAIKGKNQELQARLSELEQRSARDARNGRGDAGGVLDSPLAAVAESAGFKAFMSGATNSGRIPIAATLAQLSKSTIITGPAPGGIPASAYQRPIIGPPPPRVRVFDLFPRQRVTGGQFEFVQIIVAADSAGVQVPEGSAKKEGTVSTAPKVATIATVATWSTVSKQALSDNASLLGTLSNAFSGRVLEKAHSLIVSGDGGAVDVISGLVEESTLIITAAGSVADKVSEAISIMEEQGYSPGAVILNPTTWHTVRTAKAAPGGEYLAGSWNVPATPNIWGLPVVTTGALGVDQALVVDPSFVLLLDREEANVMLSSEDRDNFIKNMITVLAEVRVGLAVLDVGAVGLVDLTDA